MCIRLNYRYFIEQKISSMIIRAYNTIYLHKYYLKEKSKKKIFTLSFLNIIRKESSKILQIFYRADSK